REPRHVTIPALGVLARPLDGEQAILETCGERMFGREAIIDIDRQVSSFGELHPELAMRFGAATDPTAAVQVDDHRMRSVALGHCNIGGETGTKLDGFVEGANL